MFLFYFVLRRIKKLTKELFLLLKKRSINILNIKQEQTQLIIFKKDFFFF